MSLTCIGIISRGYEDRRAPVPDLGSSQQIRRSHHPQRPAFRAGAQGGDRWAARPLRFNPGKRWEYSNANYILAARI